eukprot:maker-scaffold237_size242172-snap-gene-1.26 protein:Tk05171 transcript:maker-scaffold237_size242172-snap-gene-1.26-mRNA-1 annotation:"Hemocytin"
MHDYGNYPASDLESCQPRCSCQDGYVLEQSSGRCIKPSQCPCHHGRRSFNEGETIKKDCNTCECHEGAWKCTEKPCPMVCSAWGNSHYQTFDGRDFDFHGTCEYVLAKGQLDEDEGFQVNIQNVPCGTSDVTCSKSITLSVYGSENITEIIHLVRGKPLPEPGSPKRIILRNAGLFTFVEVFDLGLVLQWDGSNRLYVRLRPSWSGRAQGLCGNGDTNDENDFKTPIGIVEGTARAFGDSWKLHKYCPNAPSIQDTCALHPQRKIWAAKKCSILRSSVFQACHSEVPIDPWLERCIQDTCGCNVGGDCECLCTAVAAYAQECSIHGVPIQWRSQELCPMQCNSKSSYSSCIATCPPKSCQNLHNYKAVTLFCPQEPCVEGWYLNLSLVGCLPNSCPHQGEIFTSDQDFTCLKPTNCRVKCMQRADGSWVYEGEVVERDDCRTCFCSRGKQRCSGSQCGFDGNGYWNQTQTNSTITTVISNSSTSIDKNGTNAEVILTCTQGWTGWINDHHPTGEDPNEVELVGDYTKLKTCFLDQPSESGSNAWCAKGDMKKIECRRVATHEPLTEDLPLPYGAILGGPKKLTENLENDDVTCNLEQGAVCHSQNGRKCHDYEYRIYCQCTSTTIIQNITIDSLHSCDPTQSLLADPKDCHLYKECIEEEMPYGGKKVKFVEKSCGDSLMFNPYTMECDWSHNVAKLRPICQVKTTTTQRTTTASTTSTTGEQASLRECDPNVPHIPHENDCQYFYHCSHPTYGGVPSQVLKKCGPGTLFHPIKMICTWPNEVFRVRPDCGNGVTEAASTTTTPLPKTTAFVFKSTATPLQKCEEDRRLKSLVNDPNVPLADDAFSSSSSLEQYPPASARMTDSSASIAPSMRYKRQSPVRDLVVHDVECLTADLPRAGMTSGLFGFKALAGGEFYLTICGPKGCCETGHLDNQQNNWERGQTDTFEGSNIGECDHFDIGDSYGNSVEITLRHSGQNGGHLDWIRINGLGGTVYQCDIREKLDNDDIRAFECERTHGADFDLVEENKFERLEATTQRYRSIHKRSTWEPEVLDTHQYLQVSFESAEPIFGIVVRGDSEIGAYVTSYYVMYSWDGISYSYVENEYGQPQLFKGSVDPDNPVRQVFDRPIEARYIRVNPQSWVDNISLQIDVLGCETITTTQTPTTTTPYLEISTQPPTPNEECQQPMGLEKGGPLPLDRVTVSSVFQNDVDRFGPSQLGLKTGTGWKPASDANTEYITVDFTDLRDLTGIQIAGGKEPSYSWVEAFRVKFSQDGLQWNKILDAHGTEKVFLGNHDSTIVSLNYFERPIRARYLKLVPLKWHGSLHMRVEVLGCYEPYPTPETSTMPYVPPVALSCVPCPNVPFESMPGCSCPDGLLWDGQACVLKDQCPCFQGYQRYEVGSIFESEDCEECQCHRGGATQCHPKTCSSCSNPYQHVELTPQCECLCKGCAQGTLLCPSDGNCVAQEKWCNGVNDCSDDETNCPTKPPKLVDTTPETIGKPELVFGYVVTRQLKCPLAEPTEATAPPVITQMATESTATPSKRQCSKPVCPPDFNLKETEIETTDGCLVYKCHKSDGNFYCPPVQCDDGTLPEFYQDSTDFGFPHKEDPDRSPVKLDAEETEELDQIFNYRKKRSPQGGYGSEDAIDYENEPEFGDFKCPKYTCVGSTTAPSIASTTTAPIIEPIEDESRCEVDGKSIRTFDGVRFKLSICHHILAREREGKWQIIVHQKCVLSGKCRKEIAIKHGNDVVTLHDSFKIEYKNNEYTPQQMESFTTDNQVDFKVAKIGGNLMFRSKIYPLRLVLTKGARIEVEVTAKLLGRLEGLCGFFNDDVSDDKQSPSGELIDSSEKFGTSWQVPGSETCRKEAAQDSCPEEFRSHALRACQMIPRLPPFNKCGSVMDLDQYTAKCFESACQCMKEVRAGRSPDDPIRACRCRTMADLVGKCLEKDRSIPVEGWREQHFCPAKCPKGQLFRDCHNTACEPTCQNFRQNVCDSFDETKICFPGCFCPEGTVKSGQTCVPKFQCRDCVCKINQRSHKYTSFDERSFKYAANCSYLAVRHIARDSDFEIRFTNEECPKRQGEFCTMSVEAKVGAHSIHVGKSIQTDQLVLYFNGEPSELDTETLVYSSAVKPNGDIHIVLSEINVEIVYNMALGSVVIGLPSETYGGKMAGICGNCNVVPGDDLHAPDGSNLEQSVPEFFDSWTTKYCTDTQPPTSLPQIRCFNEDKSACQALQSATFSQCNPLVDPTPFIEDCEEQLCLDPNFSLCTHLSEYGNACNSLGLCIPFRDGTNCSRLACSM